MAIAASTAATAPIGADVPARRVQLVGTVIAMVAGGVLIGALLGGYFEARKAGGGAGGDWAPANSDFPNAALAVTYGALVLSAFSAQWAVAAIRMNVRRHAYVAFGITLLMGAAFVNGLSFCWSQFGMVAGDSAFANHTYAVTATHLVLVLAAVVYLVVVAFRVFGGQFGPRNADVVWSAVLFWHFIVVAGAAVYWCIWFLPGGP
jgi:heme/copper-type cytochrome/quinol oxidase subunit 3